MFGAAHDTHSNAQLSSAAKRRRAALLQQQLKNTKALQQIAREKEDLHAAMSAHSDALRVSEARRRAAERRVRQLEKALRAVHDSTSAMLAGSARDDRGDGDTEAEDSE